MKTYVINRKNAVERRKFQEKQLSDLCMDFEFVEAVEGSSLTNEYCSISAQTWPSKTYRQDIGCFLSHRKVWEIVEKRNSRALIIEDDVVLSNKIRIFIDDLNNALIQRNEAFDLEYTPEIHTISKSTKHHFDISERISRVLYKNRVGLAAYIITPYVASRMLNETKEYKLVDSYFWHRPWLSAQQIEPALAVQFRFMIDQKEKVFLRNDESEYFQPKNAFVKLRNRISIELNRTAWILRSINRSDKRLIIINPKEFYDENGRSEI